MTDRRFTVPALAVLALTLLAAPAVSAQSIWDRIRDRAERQRDDDYRRDRRDRDDDYRRNRRDDDYRRGRGGVYDSRQLRDLARRIEDRSGSFQRNLDRALDRSRIDDTRREDNINEMARDFRNAADRFRNAVGNGNNDMYRSQDEAQQLLQLGSRLERVVGRVRLDSRTSNDWYQIRADLRTVADIYRMGNYDNGGYGRGRGRGNGYPWE